MSLREDFNTQIITDRQRELAIERAVQRSRNPLRLTDAGVRWLILFPILILVLGIALLVSEWEYLRLAEIYLPDPAETILDFQLPTL